MERLSVASAVAAGHDVTVFSYSPKELRAEELGATVEDAREVLDAPELSCINTRVPDHFSDWFRVEGLAQGRGTWFDLDMVVVRPLGDEPSLMAWERPGKSICGAVLALPAGSPVLNAYLAFCRKRPITYAPPWYPPHTRLSMTWKRFEKWASGKPPPRLLYGPAALTHFVEANGALGDVLPQETYYPFSPTQLDQLRVLVDGEAVTRYMTPATRAVHLWRSLYKRENGMGLPPQDSWLGRLVREYDVARSGVVAA
jgi:hypothetical protein